MNFSDSSIKRQIFWVIFIGTVYSLKAQSFDPPSKLKQFSITVNYDDYTVKTEMLAQPKTICVSNDRTYMWYAAQKIMETKGGYDGKLIHGPYRSFYLNNQLREKGFVKNGLRNKQWKYWYSDGKLREVITWKNGTKCGPYELYNDFGQLMAKGRFKNDKLQGKFYTYGNGGSLIEKKVYKNGNELESKVKKEKHKKTRKKKDKIPENAEDVIDQNSRNKTPDKTSTNPPPKKPALFRRLFQKKQKPVRTEPVNEKGVITSI
jgi:hypothetical protein